MLLDVLEQWTASRGETGGLELNQFLNTPTNSPWAPSLDCALGEHYFRIGRYSLALEHWELAWEATKHFPAGNGKKVADYALAHWTSLLASLGRVELLEVL